MDQKHILSRFFRLISKFLAKRAWVAVFSDWLFLSSQKLRASVLHVLSTCSALACLCVFVLLILDFGFHLSEQNRLVFSQFQFYCLFYFFVDVLAQLVLSKKRVKYFLLHPMDIFVVYLFVDFVPFFSFLDTFFMSQLLLLAISLGRLNHLKTVLILLRVKPAQLFLLTFLFVIFMGSLLLSLPISMTTANGVSYLDALFTSFSAVCVTGLSVNELGRDFTLFGQFIVLILIQIGGLGIMTFSLLLSIVTHKKISQVVSKEFQDSYSTVSLNETFRAIFFIFKVTFLFELLGALLLYLFWREQFPEDMNLIFSSVFHAVSAFCNAGFSLFSDSLISQASVWPIMMTFSFLIIVGGLGFPVLFNLFYYKRKAFFGARIKLQTKIALVMSAILLAFGTVFIFFGEYNHALKSYSFLDKLLISFFQSVSCRTAGFNSVDLSLFRPATFLILMPLMIIGASPGSTGGGIKTTTFGLLMVSFWNNLKSSRVVNLMRRQVDEKNIIEASSLLFLALATLAVFGYFLFLVEEAPFLPLVFELVSAFGTVGFSLDMTGQLSNSGKIIIMILMYIGRVGPLSILYTLSRRKQSVAYRYPKEDLVL